ncbi:MAG: [FeFe] hydrogenase H-cluster maturation GTPase HydF [Bacteroidales bacterium]
MNKGRDLKPHIGIFGRRNVGKSSFINVLTDSDTAIVSDIPGTTTDPVKKSMEIFGIGPAVIIDTAGIDDEGDLGRKRVERTLQTLRQIDLAILIISENRFGKEEVELISSFRKNDIPFIIIHNKSDLELLKNSTIEKIREITDAVIIEFSNVTNWQKEKVIEAIRNSIPETSYVKPSLFGGLIKRGDVVMLITPIDLEAPEGRLILPQVMAIRDVLDNDAINIVLKETEVEAFLKNSGIKPNLVVTDSQVFGYVNSIIPKDIPLTGFSIAYARMRGPFEEYVKGVTKLSNLNDGDRILILESCTHQVNCDDIGRFKLPRWIREFSKKELEFDVVSGLTEITRPLNQYALVIQCGGCMITRKQVFARLKPAIDAGIPVTNYGITIAYLNGILDRALEPFMK